MKRLLITGGRGFVGRHCLEPALAAGFEVHATASALGAAPVSTSEPVHWHGVDLLAPGAVEELLARVRPSHILHTAWETTHGSYWTSPANLAWLGLLTRMIPAFLAAGGERFVATGSCAEYDWGAGMMQEGRTAEAPHSFYGQIKLAHHATLSASAAQLGFSAATGRIFFAYGPHENPARIIPYACRQLGQRLPAELSSGVQWRDFMHVADVGCGLVALLCSDIQGACNVSAGTAVSLAEIATKLGQIAGRPDLVRLGARPDRPDDPPLLCGCNDLLRATGWAPQIALDAGLAESFVHFGQPSGPDRP